LAIAGTGYAAIFCGGGLAGAYWVKRAYYPDTR